MQKEMSNLKNTWETEDLPIGKKVKKQIGYKI